MEYPFRWVLLPLLAHADTLLGSQQSPSRQTRAFRWPFHRRELGRRFRVQRLSEDQDSSSLLGGEKQLPLQYGKKSNRQILRQNPGTLPAPCLDAGGVFPGVVLQPGDDQARGIARFSSAE